MDFRWLSLHVLRPIKIVTKTARKHHSMVGLMMWNPIDIPCFPIESHIPHYIYIYTYIYIYVHGCYIQYPIIHIIWSWNHHIPWFISFTMFHYYPIINVKYPNVISRRCSHPPFLLIRTVGLGLGLLPPTSGLGSPGEVGTRLERGVTFFFGGKTMGKWMRKLWWLSRLVELYI